MGNTAVDLVSAGPKWARANERWLFRFLDLSLKPGQCTGVVGRNGMGKTTLLRICMGERPPDEGKVNFGRKLLFNYIDQGRMQLNDGGTVLSEVADEGDTVRFGDRVISARAYLRRFLFAEERVKEPVSRLSGGERARLMLAKVLKRGGNLLVLDEPTNDLDLPSLRLLEEALVDFEGSVLVVSHDRYFLDRICDQIVAFEEGGVFVQPGNFSYYLEKKLERDQRRRQGTCRAIRDQGVPRDRSATAQAQLQGTTRTRGHGARHSPGGIAGARTRGTGLNDPAFYAKGQRSPAVDRRARSRARRGRPALRPLAGTGRHREVASRFTA
jgi:ABC-type multidrug transport system ATPase subunit